MKTRRHDSVRGIERLFNTITMVHIHVDIQNPGMYPALSAGDE